MPKRILVGLLVFLLVVVGAAGAFLWRAHSAIRRERSPLPAVAAVAPELAADPGAPGRLGWINTASQDMPRAAALDPDLDPQPDAPYRMSHPSFVLEWPDGRLLLVDLGMTQDAAREFGEPLESFADAESMETHTPTAQALGERANDVAGVILSHTHTDHVQGIAALCSARTKRLPVYATEAQIERPNYLTRPGLEMLREAGCVDLIELRDDDGDSLLPVPGLPGVRVIDAGGHTPGSQIVVARLDSGEDAALYAFVGDIVNARAGIEHDVPKPWLYRTFVVPEDHERQGELRRWLRDLNRSAGFTPLVAHDELATRSSGVAPWKETPGR
ncbi:MAG: MBL fold metallo-hydrolase [Deltaproteobacteria bacterium]|nr:MBL fold metallo-hydrolase [Deltaproteobacteria bacterium]